jgi:hypothetical protein
MRLSRRRINHQTASVCVHLQVIKNPKPTGTLDITKGASPSSGAAGTVFTFTIVVTPKGSVDNVIVTDPIPVQLTNAQLLTTFGGECTTVLDLERCAMKLDLLCTGFAGLGFNERWCVYIATFQSNLIVASMFLSLLP